MRSALRAASPRYSLPATPLRSYFIHGAVLLLWVGLFAMVFRFSGVAVWSVGVAYVAYDTVLLAFVFGRRWGWRELKTLRSFDRLRTGGTQGERRRIGQPSA